MNLNEITDTIQSCNINFLLGSGLSAPFLATLGPIECLLTELDDAAIDPEKKKLIRVSLYKAFFDRALAGNPQILSNDSAAMPVLGAYREFLLIWNTLLLRRKSTILSKESNIFTTNVDVFLEKALEDQGLEYNDGFNGRFRPLFSLNNFKKSRFKRSLHFDNKAEIPVFNLVKLHGSLSWCLDDNREIIFSSDLRHVVELREIGLAEEVLPVSNETTLPDLVAASEGKSAGQNADPFIQRYERLLIVNPTKEKFKLTLLNETYYEFLRLYANELEKENTVLFVMGFSFADGHIRDVTLRAANSNPTLIIHIFAHTSDAKKQIGERLGERSHIKNGNIFVHEPPKPKDGETEEVKYDLDTINKLVFGKLLRNEERQ